MAGTIKKADPATVTELLKATLVPDMKSATKALKDFERTYETYPEFTLEDAEMMYRECVHIIRNSDNAILRYNALRLLKYAVTTEDFLRRYAPDIWMLYKETIFDPDGNIRRAGCQLMSRYRFGVTFIADPFPLKKKRRDEKSTEEIRRFEKMFVEQCLELFQMEKQYKKTHPDLDDVEEENLFNIPRGSEDTKDKYLKTIRYGMEEVTRYARMGDLAVKHGYRLPDHWLFEGQLQEEENEWPPGTEGDLAGVLVDPKGDMPMHVSDPPNPKSFSSCEEYQEALALRDDFLLNMV